MWWRKPEATVLILCTANVCRSPVAAALLRAELKRFGLGRRVGVVSAGTAVTARLPVDARMRALAAAAGVKLSGSGSTPLDRELLSRADAVYAMELSHLEAAAQVLNPPEGQLRGLFHPAGKPVPDPYFGTMADVRAVFEEIADCAGERALQWRRRLEGG